MDGETAAVSCLAVVLVRPQPSVVIQVHRDGPRKNDSDDDEESDDDEDDDED